MSRDNASFCSTPLWDSALSWHTEEPDLTRCFEQTVLVWGPCLLLWLLSPVQIYTIIYSPRRDIPWRFVNKTKLVLSLLLVAVSAVDLLHSSLSYLQGEEKVFPVDIYTPAIQTVTFGLAVVLLLWNRVRGLHTSAVLFFFWLTLSVAGLPQFRSELRQARIGGWRLTQALYLLYYSAVLLMFFLNWFADPPPRITEYPKSQKLCPEMQASFTSRMFFYWFDPLIWKGIRRPLTVADLWQLRHQDSAVQINPRFHGLWQGPTPNNAGRTVLMNGKAALYTTLPTGKQRTQKPASILGPLLKTLWLPLLGGGLLRLFSDAFSFANPQILFLMIEFVRGKEAMWKGVMYAVLMFTCAEAQSFLFNHYMTTHYVIGLNWRTAIMSALYKKSLRISNAARKEFTVGEVVNLMAVDAHRLAEFAPYLPMLWASPLIISVALYFLWQILGISTLAGLFAMVTVIPINIVIAKRVETLQKKQMKYKDKRVKLMNEVLSGIKVLKLYAWEPSFRDYVSRIREKELSVMRTAALLNASTSFVWLCSSFLVSLVTFCTYVMIDDSHVLTSEVAFVSTSLFNIIRTPLGVLPMLIQMTIQCLVSVKRLNKFINAEELDVDSVSHDVNRKETLIVEKGTFSWGAADTDVAVLRNINLTVKPGSLVAVVGAVGSGKSSLISAFLGEMDKLSGYINTKGKMAYVPQQAWIQNATVRENILFGNGFNRERYYKTVDLCALKSDFDMLPAGDNTEIGEKGINLSGGQKQRVSLARAVYSEAEIYLLDDPLSAVDSHVGKHIFNWVIGPKGILSNKTRVLVTHGVTFLPQVDVIVVMKAGEITETGTFKELLHKKGEFSEFLVQHITTSADFGLEEELGALINEHPELKSEIQREVSKSGSVQSINSMSSQKKVSQTNLAEQPTTVKLDKLIQAEKTETGSVKWSVYMHYLNAAGLLLSLATVGFQLLSQGLNISANIYLSAWTSDNSTAVNGTQVLDKRDYYLEKYIGFGFGQMAAVIASAFALAFGTVFASKYLHHSMLFNILRSPMSFFDTTPTGRIVNRFGKDIDLVDNTLPYTLSNALSSFGNVFATIVVITWSTPIFAAIILPVGLLYYAVQRLYIATSRQIKRIESVSRSPIYSHFSETVTGATSIRAYGVEERFIKTSEDRIDTNQMCLYPSWISNRWLGIRLETIGNILIFFAALFAILGRDSLDAGIVGLSVSYALQITSMLRSATRMSSEVENHIVSVERIVEYSKVPQEAAWEVHPRPNREWPSQGTVQFEDYRVRYREGLELVLKGVSFFISGGEKIGIVGRTGAGKSSLTLSLFRLVEGAGGHIYIDGLDIAKVGLGDLRSRITIIPQDPVLFSGSLRMNLDPFGVYTDDQLWRALEHAHLGNFAHGLAAGLSFEISEGGDNLSVGQRQLVCLARALLRKTKILVLDEATAAVDLDTDDLIQKTIREEFRDCTVLTIAHRLNTIMDSDRVLVLDKGEIMEFDSPSRLLQSTTSVFHSMARDAGLA